MVLKSLEEDADAGGVLLGIREREKLLWFLNRVQGNEFAATASLLNLQHGRGSACLHLSSHVKGACQSLPSAA